MKVVMLTKDPMKLFTYSWRVIFIYQTPIMIATYYNFIDIVAILLRRSDIDLNTRTISGATVLMTAVDNGFFDIVSLLTLDIAHKNLEINARNNRGLSALALAVGRNDIRTIQLLLDCPGIDPNTKGPNGVCLV